MPTDNKQGLFAELGIGRVDEQAALQKGMGELLPATSVSGGFMQLGQKLGRTAGGGARDVVTALGNRGNQQGFKKNFAQADQDAKDAFIARGLGLPNVQALHKQRQSRREIGAIKVAPTGDAVLDQIATLDQVISVARRNGDTELVMRANQKRIQLRGQAQELKKLDMENKTDERALELQGEGEDVFMVGDSFSGKMSRAEKQDDGLWTVYRHDGTVLQGIDGGLLHFGARALKAASGGGGSGGSLKWKSPLARLQGALRLNGMVPNTIMKTRNTLTGDMLTQAKVVGTMAEGLTSMNNANLSLSTSAVTNTAAAKVITLVDSLASIFTPPTEEITDIMWKDARPGAQPRRVSKQTQYANATRKGILDEYAAEYKLNILDIIPKHIAEDRLKAEAFRANIMQLAYLDARLQEPSNRGLSDNDIKNALQRLGVGDPNPMVFVNRQLELMSRLRDDVQNLGIGFTTVHVDNDADGNPIYVTAEQLKAHVYNPAAIELVENQLSKAEQALMSAREKLLGLNTDTGKVDDATDQAVTVNVASQKLLALGNGDIAQPAAPVNPARDVNFDPSTLPSLQ